VPRPTIVGTENHYDSLFEMNYFKWEMKTINGSLFEMNLTCREMLKYHKVNVRVITMNVHVIYDQI